jgi:hypothetical protein
MDELKKNYAITLGPGQLALIVVAAIAIGGGGSGLVASRFIGQAPQTPVTLSIDTNLEHRLTLIEAKLDVLDATVKSKLQSK